MATTPMNIEEWATHLLAAWTSHDVEKILSFYADDCVFQDFAIGRILNGKKALRAYLEESFANLPDFRIEAKSSFASGDRVCIEWIMSGTRGSLPGMAVINKNYSVPGVAVIEPAQGKAKREADYWDSVSMMRRLGLLPEAMAADSFVGTWKLNVAFGALLLYGAFSTYLH